MLVGTLRALRRYPVKGLRGEALDAADVRPSGIPGDRERAFFVRSGSARAGKTYRGKEDDRLHLFSSVAAAATAAAQRGVDVELRSGAHFFDAAPISILVDRWLRDVSRHVGYSVEWERFRPNLFVEAARDFVGDERELTGADLRLGTARLRVRSPIERCVVVTYDLQGGQSEARILRFVAEHRNACLGIYCDVLEPGTIRVDDLLTKEAP